MIENYNSKNNINMNKMGRPTCYHFCLFIYVLVRRLDLNNIPKCDEAYGQEYFTRICCRWGTLTCLRTFLKQRENFRVPALQTLFDSYILSYMYMQ